MMDFYFLYTCHFAGLLCLSWRIGAHTQMFYGFVNWLTVYMTATLFRWEKWSTDEDPQVELQWKDLSAWYWCLHLI